eukprot:2310710-Rhodomonas_salina.1
MAGAGEGRKAGRGGGCRCRCGGQLRAPPAPEQPRRPEQKSAVLSIRGMGVCARGMAGVRHREGGSTGAGDHRRREPRSRGERGAGAERSDCAGE